jgi:hypothetical protein
LITGPPPGSDLKAGRTCNGWEKDRDESEEEVAASHGVVDVEIEAEVAQATIRSIGADVMCRLLVWKSLW